MDKKTIKFLPNPSLSSQVLNLYIKLKYDIILCIYNKNSIINKN